MPITQTEFETILADSSKRIEADIKWNRDEDHSPVLEFRAEILSAAGYPIFAHGSYNRKARRLSYAVIHRGTGRIYGLCLGQDHHNPTCQFIGVKHKHRWTDQFADKEAYIPGDITATAEDPLAAWKQFYSEAKIEHTGAIQPPPPIQEELPL